MKTKVTVRYVYMGAAHCDTLLGTNISSSLENGVVNIKFPEQDGIVLSSMIVANIGLNNLSFIMYGDNFVIHGFS